MENKKFNWKKGLFIAIAVFLILEIALHWDDAKRGFNDAYNGRQVEQKQ